MVFGVYLANRSTEEESQYPTLCLVPLRVQAAEGLQLAEAAAKIQQNLHDISNVENVSVGLWEIKEWTGVVVDSFVNFLSLPGKPKGRLGQTGGDGGVQLQQVGFDEMKAAGESTATVHPVQIPWLKTVVGDAYPVSCPCHYNCRRIRESLKTDIALDRTRSMSRCRYKTKGRWILECSGRIGN